MAEMTRRTLLKQAALLGVSLPAVRNPFSLLAARAGGSGNHPTLGNRPICPRGAPPEIATFIDPTVTLTGAEQITLGQRVYLAPFARLVAEQAPISLDADSNAQDNVTIIGAIERDSATEQRIARLGLERGAGVAIAARCVLAHGATVKGPARIGIGGGTLPVFLSFGAEVDGAILERNTSVSPLARVGPGVRLRSGYVVLPGKNVATQEEAEDTALGKVRLATESDIVFHETVVEVNTAFADAYTRLFSEDPSALEGINVNPGHTHFTPSRSLPTLAGTPTCLPGFRNRIIGAVELTDTLEQVNSVLGERIALRADEGTPFRVGHIQQMRDEVIFHALEHTDLQLGHHVTYGAQVIVHGGLRQPGNQPTVVEDEVLLKSQSVIFRAHVGRGSTIGEKSAVISSEVPPGTTLPDRVIYLNNTLFGVVEW